jgi:hypothetical protein
MFAIALSWHGAASRELRAFPPGSRGQLITLSLLEGGNAVCSRQARLPAMSELGQQQTSAPQVPMSALHLSADFQSRPASVRCGPRADGELTQRWP